MNQDQKQQYEAADGGQAHVKEHHLRTHDLLKLSIRAFKVRPLRTFLTILGMSVGIGTVFFLISLGYGLQYILLGKLAPNEDSLQSLEAYYPGENDLKITPEKIAETRQLGTVTEVSPVAEVPGELVLGPDLTGTVIVKIIEHNYFKLSGFQSDYGMSACPVDHGGVIVSNTALRILNLPEDDTSLNELVTVRAFYANSEDESAVTISESRAAYPIVGIVRDDSQMPYVYIAMSDLTVMPAQYDKFFAKADSLEVLEELRNTLTENGFIISARIDTVSQARKITTVITIVLGVFGVAALVVSAIGMFNTMLISFMERIFEVGIMKSIGATRRDIINLFLMESLVMGLLGGIGGIVLGAGVGQLFNLGLNILARYLGGRPVNLFVYPVKFMLLIIVISAVVGILSGFWPARRAATLSAREAFLRK